MAELTHIYPTDNNTLVESATDDLTVHTVSGASLSANTKYLIVARALTGGSSVSGVYDMWVETADDATIATKSLNKMEPMQTGNQALASYFFVHSYTTDASPADVLLKVTSSTGNSHADQMSLFLLDLDAIGNTPIASYYFDATDAGPTDAGGDWTDDSNAFDGDTGTGAGSAFTDGIILSGEGTTAPTSGAAIGAVTFRAYLRVDSSSTSLAVTIDEDSVGGTTLAHQQFWDGGTGLGWTNTIPVDAPSGGWTWQKVNDLAVSFTRGGTSGIANVYKCEVQVYGSDGVGYLEGATSTDSGTDLSATEATTVLAEIAGSDMGTDEHFILGYGRWDNGNNGKYGEVTLYTALDASSQAEVAYSRREGEDTNEQVVVGFAARHQASSGTPNATIYGETASGGGGQHTDGGGYIIALPTSLFADSVFEYTAAAVIVDGTETTLETSGSYTPTTTGNHLILGWANGSVTPSALGGMWVESTTTEIRTGDSTPTHNQIWDATKDDEIMATFQRYSITTVETLNLRAQGAGSSFRVANRWLIVVNLNEAGGDTPGSASPATIARSFTVDAVTPVGPAVDVQNLTARSFTVDAPAVHGAAVDVQDAIARSFAMGAPTLVGPAVDVQDLINRSFALDAVTTSNTDGAPGSASPAATARAFTVDAATPVGAAVDVQDLISRAFTVDAPAAVGAGVDVQDLIARSFVVNAPTQLVGPGVQTAPLINRSFALDQVAPAAPRTVTPGVIARSFTVDAPTTDGAAVATPAAIARSFTVDIPTLVGAGVDVQDLIALSFALDQVTPIPGGTTVSVAAIERSFTVEGVTLVGRGVQTAPLIARVFALDLVTLAAPRTVTPAVIARAFALGAVTTAGAGVDVQDLIARSFGLGATIQVGPGVDVQDLIARSFALGIPTLAGAGVDVQDLIARSFGIGSVTTVGGGVDVQDLIARSFVLDGVTPAGAAVDVQDLIARVFVLDAVTTSNTDSGAGTASPAAIVRTFALGTPTLVGGGVDVQALISKAFALGAATPRGAAVDLQDLIARAFTLGAPTLAGGGVDVQDVIARTFALGAATGAGAGLVLPGAITLAFTVDAVTTAGGGVVSAPTVVLVLTLPLVGTANSDAALLVAIVEASVIGRTRVLVAGRTRGQVTQQDRGTIRDRSRGRIDDRDRVT